MAKNKLQHTVPKAYLGAWTNSNDDRLFLYDLEKDSLHDKGQPKTICREPHFYTLDELGESDKYIFDDLLTNLERIGLPIIQKIHQGKQITCEEKDSLAWFIAAQKIRTPYIRRQQEKMAVDLVKRKTLEITKDEKKFSELLEHLKSKCDVDKNVLKRMEKDPTKYFQDSFSNSILSIENAKEVFLPLITEEIKWLVENYISARWYILRACKGTSFITSDNPVTTSSALNDDSKFTTDNISKVEVVFPLSPQISILMRHYPGEKKIRRRIIECDLTESKESVREINFRTFMNSDRYIFSTSQNLLIHLVKRFYSTFKDKKKHNITEVLKENEISKGLAPKNFQLIHRNFKSSACTLNNTV